MLFMYFFYPLSFITRHYFTFYEITLLLGNSDFIKRFFAILNPHSIPWKLLCVFNISLYVFLLLLSTPLLYLYIIM